MERFIAGESQSQSTLFPERLDGYIAEDNPVRVIDVFVDKLDQAKIGTLAHPQVTGHSVCLPTTLQKSDVWGYVNRIQSNCGLERDTLKNIGVMWVL
jgi:hypothetical protein